MDYTTAYSWMLDNASDQDFGFFSEIRSEEEAIEYAESLGAYDTLEDL